MKRSNVTIVYPHDADPRAYMAKARECCKEIGIEIRVLRATRSSLDAETGKYTEMSCKIECPEGALLEEGVLLDYIRDTPASV